MLEAAAARLSSGGCTATEQIRALFQPWPEGECGPTDEPESQYRFGYNTAIEDALEALSTAPAQSCEQAEFGTARERFISGAPVQASEHVLELARQALAARDSDTRTDDEKIAAAVDFICDTRLDQPVKCGDAEQADEAVTDATERMKALWGVLMCQVVETSSESYLSLRCVGMPPTDDEFALAVNRAIDAARAKDSK
jgi:hypothetical protein